MLIKVDYREAALLQQMNNLILTVPSFKSIKIKTENLPIGDIIINNETEDKIIIERKSISDLLSSIKDGRYDEQSYRLNGLDNHNHNIFYLIEGDINKPNRFKPTNNIEKLTLYSAMFSLNYFKGFSVMRSFSMEETAFMVCNMAYKLEKDLTKRQFYPNKNQVVNEKVELVFSPTTSQKIKVEDNVSLNLSTDLTPCLVADLAPCLSTDLAPCLSTDLTPCLAPPFQKVEKVEYVNVIKKVKKENITPDNIGEIMLCQIPGISSVTALAIMEKYQTLPNLIKELELNNESMKDLSYTNAKGQSRKINKTCIINIVKFLLKK
jgi:ERCC4-type nuclease